MRYLSSSAHAAERRPGVVLLVVMAMLALFASLALSFVFYADAEATSTQLAMQSQVKPVADVDPETLAAYFLGQLLYDSNNTESALRGWSMARSIYGYNPAVLNFIPYNGVGRTALAQAVTFPNGVNVNNANLVNYQNYVPPAVAPTPWRAATGYVFGNLVRHTGNVYFCTLANTNKNPATPANTGIGSYWMLQPVDPWANVGRTPEWYGTAASGAAYRYVGGANPPWTAFDTNSLFLAQMNADGTLVNPSFTRPWWNAGVAANSAALRYGSLAPDPFWNPTFYPLPDADDTIGVATNHVRNRDSGPPGNDSKWMDVGFPVFTAPNGKRYKPLVASLILDLNSRINMWAHGNRLGKAAANTPIPPNTPYAVSVSNQGWGPSEVNPGRLTGMNFAELLAFHNFKYGGAAGTTNSLPMGSPLNFPQGAGQPPWYATADYDGGGLDPSGANTVGTYPFAMGAPNPLPTISRVAGAGRHTVTVTPISGVSTAGFPWVITAGMPLTVSAGATADAITVISVDIATNSMTATFGRAHPAGTQIHFGSPQFAFPYYYPPGWNNSVGEIANAPLGFSLFNPIAPNMRPTAGSLEALSRYYGTNGPALPSDIFQRMPSTFAEPQLPVATTLRAAVTLAPAGVPALHTVPVTNVANIVVGMQLTVGTENVIVTAVNAAANPPTISAIFTKNHVIRPPTTVTSAYLPGLRNKVTMSSAWLDRITAAPFLNFDPTTVGHYQYQGALAATYPATPPYPQAAASLPTPPNPAWPAVNWAAPPVAPVWSPNSDLIQGDWRSNLGTMLRINLNRTPTSTPPLRDFPTPNAATGLIPVATAANRTAYDNALNDRTQFARDIYNALIRVTGAQDPNKALAAVATSTDYQAARWLAQLAVNIVDYIDDDDYSTPFQWVPGEFVFGTELPRVVLNEVYALNEAPANQVGVWAELHNTFKPTPAGSTYPLDGGDAVLQLTAAASPTPPYIIEIHTSDAALTSWLRSPTNNMGQGLAAPASLLTTQATWATAALTERVAANNGAPGGTISQHTIATATVGPASVTITTVGAHGFKVGQAVTITGVHTRPAPGVPIPGYEGTYDITGVPSTTTFKFTPVGVVPNGAGGTATAVLNPNVGFYVIGPAGLGYTSAALNPKLPATYVSPSMSFTPPAGKAIRPVAPTVAATGASAVTAGVGVNAVTTVTINTVAAHGFATGDVVTIANVAPVAPIAVSPYNGTFTITVLTPTSFSYRLAAAIAPAPPNSGGGTATLSSKITVLLRRLANPHLKANAVAPGTAALPYNPYITIDYQDGITVNQVNAALAAPQPLGASISRNQPYAAHASQTLPLSPNAAVGVAPTNTFFAHNTNAPGPFDWLVHLDRPPVNALELMNVSGFKPHELTQQFAFQTTTVAANEYNPTAAYVVNNEASYNGIVYKCIQAGTGQTPTTSPTFWALAQSYKFQHLAPWNPFAPTPYTPAQLMTNIQNALIYRAFDVFSTANHMPGTTVGGRQPGGINPNTVTEGDIWQALCDSQDGQPNPRFTTGDVATIFNNIVAARTAAPAAPLNPLEGSPFKSFAAGNVNDTFFRTVGATPTFQIQSLATNANYATLFHPTLKTGVLQKIFNNMTTTSNVFAVYWTVGFFEVTDETVQPPRLGQEIGRSENRNIRHRFFAIVDRSGMQLFNTNSTNAVAGTTAVWNATEAYARNSLVLYQGATYQARAASTGVAPTANASNAKWTLESMNINAITGTSVGGPPPAWSATQSYVTSNAVTYNGFPYFCTQPNTNAPPATSPGNWIMLMLQPGMLLEITDNSVSPPISEVVPVTWVNPNMTSFTAPFTQSYNPGSTIVCRGNPGPQTSYPNSYNPHKDNSVVLHLSIIK